MTTVGAAFSSFEEAQAKYIAYGGSPGYSAGIPGMVTGPSYPQAYFALTSTDPRSAATGSWCSLADKVSKTFNALEPKQIDYDGYDWISRNRFAASATGLEAVDTGGGVWIVRNKTALVFPNSGVLSGGIALNYCVLILPAALTSDPFYALYAPLLQSTITIPAGGGVAPTIPAGDFQIEFR